MTDDTEEANFKLVADIAKLRENLENNPDAWFENPRGWLFRPSYKRAAQKRSSGGRASFSDRVSFTKLTTGSAFKKRWFVLDAHHKVIRYFRDDTTRVESGWIDLTTIKDIKRSTVFDAPEFAIDLISTDTNYTLAAQSEELMVRWAFAVRHLIDERAAKKKCPARPSSKGYVLVQKDNNVKNNEDSATSSVTTVDDKISDTKRWMRYDFTYQEAGPLMMNVMGAADLDKKGRVVSYWMIITSFVNFPDGSKGTSEASGVIKPKDYIVGVNGKDLTQTSFEDSMNYLRAASWPKTLHFLRDKNSEGKVVFLEHWSQVFYRSLMRSRRRYIELTPECINFRKAAPGGSAVSQRDAFFSIKQITHLRPVIDMNTEDEFNFKLQVVSGPEAVVCIVNERDESIGETSAETLELVFKEESEMMEWATVLSDPNKRAKEGPETGNEIPLAPIEVIENLGSKRKVSEDMVVAVKSDVTGQFSLKEFSFNKEGYVLWVNARETKNGSSQLVQRERKLFLANRESCGVRDVKALQYPTADADGYPFQLQIRADESKLTLGMTNETALMNWVEKMKAVIEMCPDYLRQGLVIPTCVAEAADVSESHDDDDDEDEEAEEAPKMGLGERVRSLSLIGAQAREFVNFCLTDDLSKDYVQGWLYYKHNVKIKFGFKQQFGRYFFVLREYTLLYYKSDADVTQRGKVYGSIDLLTVISIRESQDPTAMENALELVTLNRTYLLVADDEAQYMKWIDALGDTLEMRHTAAQNDPRVGSMLESPAEKLQEFKKQILHSGGLNMKGYNWLTGSNAWKQKFFVLTNSTLCYFDSADEMVVARDPSTEISVAAIKHVESSKDRSCTPSCAFDVHAHVRKGGDHKGIRVFTFESQTASLCKEWMTKICETNGLLALEASPAGDGYVSVANAGKQRDEQRRKSGQNFVVSTLSAGASARNEDRASGATDKATPFSSSDADADADADANVINRQRTDSSDSGRGNALGGRGGGRGRGMGRGFVRPGSLRGSSMGSMGSMGSVGSSDDAAMN